MSHSPLDPGNAAAANDRQAPYRKSVLQVDDLIERGNSLSGHERDVCFLNLGGKAAGEVRFATASAASGFDDDGDGRALAPLDWDGDGDLDVWMSARTAPLLRFFRNDRKSGGNDWLQLKLEATSGARDGIGAKAVVILADGAQITRVLKAGEGYLTQNTRWLHFGLGAEAKVKSVTVRWPGRKTETFTGAGAGQRWVLREGSGKATAAPLKVQTPAAGAAKPIYGGSVTARSGARPPVPLLPWETLDGKPRTVGGKSDHLTLINLWATWCPDCSEEWKDFGANAAAFEKAEVKILALSVDGLVEGGTAGDPAAHLQKLGAAFPAGRATAVTVARAERLRTHCFGVKWQLPVPASLLLDREGRLVTLWAGPVKAAEVIAEAKRASLAGPAYHDAALPFSGLWLERPEPLPPLSLALPLMENGGLDAALEYAERAAPALSGHGEYGLFLTWIGDQLMAAGRSAEAIRSYEQAVAAAPDDLTALNNLAWQLATHESPAVRNGELAVKHALRAAELTQQGNPGILDTLAAAYAAAGRFPDAVATAEKALALARSARQVQLVQDLEKSLSRYRKSEAMPR